MSQPTFTALNPATGEPTGVYRGHRDEAVDGLVKEAHEAHRDWRHTTFDHRAQILRRVATTLRERTEDYASLVTREMGKPIGQARSEVEKCAWVCEYYADNAEAFLAPEPVETDATESFVAFRPLGVVLAIMPWNFPFWQVFRFAAPALAAGNACLLKHAENVPGCAVAIEDAFRDSGLPRGLFRALLIERDQVERLYANPLVRAATLTGSTRAGRAVAAGAGRNLKKTVLELGGSDPYVILEDADLELAVAACVKSRLINSGQSCIAAKRFVVVKERYDAFVERFVAAMQSVVTGDPTKEDTDVGPMARHDLRDALHEQVRKTLAAGATCRLGGTMPEGPGAYYPPTVLTDVPKGTPGYDEELFGPVAVILRAEDAAQAIEIANDSPFGLGAAVFTADEARGRRIAAEELDAGACFVNTFARSDPRLPFGGVKESGYGRELSKYGIREFVNVKTVYVS